MKRTIIFDNTSSHFNPNDMTFNKTVVSYQLAYCNQVLKSKWLLLVNDINEALGLPRTVEGMTEGWVFPPATNAEFELRTIKKEDGSEAIEISFNTMGDIRKKLRRKETR